MNIFTKKQTFIKKAVLLTTAGAFAVTAGFFALNVPHATAAAATYGYHHRDNFAPGDHRRGEWNAEDIAANMAACFNLNKEEILKYNNDGWRFRDLHQAAFIASAGQTSLSDVLNAKTTTNTWRDVRVSFGITDEQMRSARDAQLSSRMAEQLQISANTIENLLENGYHPRDIAMASTLSKKSDKTIDTVLSMKKINNRWSDVAESLGISAKDLEQLLRDSYDRGFGFHGMHRGFFHPEPPVRP